jgi:hypothetical protein
VGLLEYMRRCKGYLDTAESIAERIGDRPLLVLLPILYHEATRTSVTPHEQQLLDVMRGYCISKQPELIPFFTTEEDKAFLKALREACEKGAR